MVNQAAPCTDENYATKFCLNALSRLDRDLPKLSIEQVAPSVDEDSAAKLHHGAQRRNKRDHI